MDLHLGCGKNKMKGAIGLDIAALKGVDLVADLSKGFPLKTGCAGKVYAYYVLEHLPDLAHAMNEIHRVLRPGGVLRAKVPYYASHHAFSDPTHRIFFSWKTFDHFTDGSGYNFYSDARFAYLRKTFACSEGNRLLGRVIMIVANRWPVFYERYLNKFLRAEWLDIEMEKE